MVRSMTGFGRANAVINGLDVTVEIKSVNHRYFEFSARMPRAYHFAEEKLKAMCQQSISRGKVELSVFVEETAESTANVEINYTYARGYIAALKQLSKEFGIKNDVKISTLANNNDIFKVRRTVLPDEEIIDALTTVTKAALESFISMRETEGERLLKDVLSKAETILSRVEEVEKRSPETVKAYRARLEQKMRELLDTPNIDEQRLITETAIFADKIAVDEETVRLRSHIKQLQSMFESEGPIGKKLDFIVQEMNRETNTIGSKSQNAEIAYIVVDMKSEIEKIREQIQNIE